MKMLSQRNSDSKLAASPGLGATVIDDDHPDADDHEDTCDRYVGRGLDIMDVPKDCRLYVALKEKELQDDSDNGGDGGSDSDSGSGRNSGGGSKDRNNNGGNGDNSDSDDGKIDRDGYNGSKSRDNTDDSKNNGNDQQSDNGNNNGTGGDSKLPAETAGNPVLTSIGSEPLMLGAGALALFSLTYLVSKKMKS